MGWRSLIGRPVIRIPSNVRLVDWFWQRQNKPQGHQLVAESVRTRIMIPRLLKRDHAYMDDASEFHDRCIESAGAWC